MRIARGMGTSVLAAAAVAAALLAADGRVTGQSGHGDHGASGTKPAVPIDGLSSHRHPIKTGNSLTQQFFDQGLNFCFAFNHEEAARAFRRAAQLDPEAPMPLWGLAYSLGPNFNMPRDLARDKEAFEAVRKAVPLAAGGTEHERDYVAAMARRYSDDAEADPKDLDEAFRDAMRDLAQRYPDDLDAATIYAESIMDLRPWKLWSSDGRPSPGTKELIAVLESVLKRDPSHPGANHYYIHAVEASPSPEKALAAAHRLEGLAPAAGHLVHMPGHIYLLTGDYAGAARVNVRAAEADRALFRLAGKQGMYPIMYYTHNLHFIMAASAMQGREAEAVQHARLVEIEIRAVLKRDPLPQDFLPMFEAFLPSPLFMDLRFRKWDAVMRLPAPDPRLVVGTALWRAGRAVARLAQRYPAGAEAEAQAFRAARAKVSEGAGFGLSQASDVLDIAGSMMDAQMLEAKGDTDGALLAWRSAVEAQARLSYNEPPDWFYPVRESLGGALLRAGRPGEAERVFRDDLERHPRSGRSLFGLWKSLEAQKRDTDAAWVKREFQAAWKNATVSLRVEDL